MMMFNFTAMDFFRAAVYPDLPLNFNMMPYGISKTGDCKFGNLLQLCAISLHCFVKSLKFLELSVIPRNINGNTLPLIDFIGLKSIFTVRIDSHLKPEIEVAETHSLSLINIMVYKDSYW